MNSETLWGILAALSAALFELLRRLRKRRRKLYVNYQVGNGTLRTAEITLNTQEDSSKED